MKRYIIPILGIASVTLLVVFWAYEKRDTVDESVTQVDPERQAACEQFLTVALFPEGGAAEDFMEACLRGDSVLPSDEGPDLPDREPIVDLDGTPYIGEGCAIGGCSNQVCGEVDEIDNMATTCEFRAEYACYPFARCEQQTSGECGWTETEQFSRCVEDAAHPGEMEESMGSGQF